MRKIGELLTFKEFSYISGAILGHSGPVVALSGDLLRKHVIVHMGFAFLAVNLLHYLFNVSPFDAV